MADYVIEAQPRTITGKKVSQLRNDGLVPAVVYGPIVLVGAMGHELKPGDDLHINERTIGSVFNEPIEVPAFAGELAAVPGKIKPTGAPLTFRTDGVGRPGDVTLVPYYKMTHQHYNMYWKIQSS